MNSTQPIIHGQPRRQCDDTFEMADVALAINTAVRGITICQRYPATYNFSEFTFVQLLLRANAEINNPPIWILRYFYIPA